MGYSVFSWALKEVRDWYGVLRSRRGGCSRALEQQTGRSAQHGTVSLLAGIATIARDRLRDETATKRLEWAYGYSLYRSGLSSDRYRGAVPQAKQIRALGIALV